MSVFWTKGPKGAGSKLRVLADPGVAAWGMILGLLLAVAGAIAWAAGVIGGATGLIQGTSFVGMSLFLTSLVLTGRRPRHRSLWRLGVVLAMVWAFSVTTFTGYGRLILVALGLVPVILLSGQITTRAVKVLVLAGVAPSMFVLVKMRQTFAEQRFGISTSGIGSVVSPLGDFGNLLSAHAAGRFDLAYGKSFFATLTFFVPRQLWPGKPIGFGALLTQILDPQLVSVGQSIVALAQGEWFYDFGWLGVAAMGPALGYALRRMDQLLDDARSRPVASKRQLLWLTAALLMVSDVPNLLWVGSFGYVARTGVRIGIVMVLMMIASNEPRADCGRE
jgi:hypothetical protein